MRERPGGPPFTLHVPLPTSLSLSPVYPHTLRVNPSLPSRLLWRLPCGCPCQPTLCHLASCIRAHAACQAPPAQLTAAVRACKLTHPGWLCQGAPWQPWQRLATLTAPCLHAEPVNAVEFVPESAALLLGTLAKAGARGAAAVVSAGPAVVPVGIRFLRQPTGLSAAHVRPLADFLEGLPASWTAAGAGAAPAVCPPRICAAPGCGATRSLRCCKARNTARHCSEKCSRAHWSAECLHLRAEQATTAQVAPAAGAPAAAAQPQLPAH